MFIDEIKEHLVKDLIPFWKSLKDDRCGGYYGYISYDLQLDTRAVKGCILNSRILWFFSNACLTLKDESLLPYARHSFQALKEYFIDQEYEGVYWSVTYEGKAADTTKHTYNQAFAVYALSSYYDASKDPEALSIARQLIHVIENKCKDEYGYLESFDRSFVPEDNDKLSENGILAEKTMNTLLHVYEAYVEFYRVSGDIFIRERILSILDTFKEKVFNPALGRQEVFFDKSWHSLIDLYSYGHDIETSWLMDRGIEILGGAELEESFSELSRTLAENVLKNGYRDHSLLNECENGINDTRRNWWVQAEAVLGFYNAYEKTNNAVLKEEFLQASEDIWNYIKTYMIDQRESELPGREWYSALDQHRMPIEKPQVEPWKCPYHNGRMCMELMKRAGFAD